MPSSETSSQSSDFHERFRSAARWCTYPASWMVVLTFFGLMTGAIIEPGNAWASVAGTLLVFYIMLETVLPYQKRWKMTWRSFFSDTKYLVVNGATMAAINAGLAYLSISMSDNLSGPASNLPFWLQLVLALVIFEACHYSLHRSMHEGRTAFNRWLWKVHAPHHLPDKLYIFMHVVGHPINQMLLQSAVIVMPIWLMGYDQHVVTAFLMLNTMHGLISHFNVDVRMGWMNYLFVGTELHRYHHSSDLKDAKNFGATLSIYDQLFGTFVYKPGIPPESLGAAEGSVYPYYGDILLTLKLPFTKSKAGSSSDALPPNVKSRPRGGSQAV